MDLTIVVEPQPLLEISVFVTRAAPCVALNPVNALSAKEFALTRCGFALTLTPSAFASERLWCSHT
jgi:hypothetical protein